jgi:type I restriction enzyme S subunit
LVKKTDEDCLVSHRFPTFEVDINKALPDYLRHVIVQKRFIRNLGLISPGGAGRNRILNKKDFLNLKISLPEIKEQERIGDFLNTSLKEISLLEAQLELLEKQKRGLMQKLLTGQWRVKIDEGKG